MSSWHFMDCSYVKEHDFRLMIKPYNVVYVCFWVLQKDFIILFLIHWTYPGEVLLYTFVKYKLSLKNVAHECLISFTFFYYSAKWNIFYVFFIFISFLFVCWMNHVDIVLNSRKLLLHVDGLLYLCLWARNCFVRYFVEFGAQNFISSMFLDASHIVIIYW